MANAAPRPGPKCPKGHTMDPNWVTCPYCEHSDSSGGRRTNVGEAPQRGERRVTRVMTPAVEPYVSDYVGEGETRRILGVLVTYGPWFPAGKVFPVREGKTFIGSGDISSEAFHRSCDVQIPEDRRMSGEHALILCRHGSYEIIDQMSSNGTFLDGRMLRANESTEIPNYAKIQTGVTVWTFIQIEPPREPVTPSLPKEAVRDPGPEPGCGETIVR